MRLMYRVSVKVLTKFLADGTGENEASEARTIMQPMQLMMEKVATQAIHHVLVLVP